MLHLFPVIIINNLYFSVNVVYVDKDGVKINVKGKVGDNILYLAHRYEIPMEGL